MGFSNRDASIAKVRMRRSLTFQKKKKTNGVDGPHLCCTSYEGLFHATATNQEVFCRIQS